MARVTRMTRKRLGEILVEEGLIDKEVIERALKEQKRTGKLIGQVLVDLGVVTEEDIVKSIVRQFGVPFLRGDIYRIPKKMKTLFPLYMLRQFQFVPLDVVGTVLIVLTAGLIDETLLQQLEDMSRCTVQLYVGTVSDVNRLIEKEFAGEAPPADNELSSLGSMLLGDETDKK